MKEEIILGESAVRDSSVIAAEINLIKRQTAQQCLRATVEIGQRLCEAKALVPHGSWGQWLEENVDYSQSTANNIMRLYNEFGTPAQMGFFEENRLEIFGSLSPSQAIALLALPQEQRAAFVESNDAESMSVREIQAKIKEMQDRAEALEEDNASLQAEVERQKTEVNTAKRSALEAERKLTQEKDRLRAEISRLKTEAESKGQQTIAIPSPQDNKQEREKIRQELEGEFSEREKKAVAAAEKELKSVRKECRELQAKADKLEIQLKTAGAVAVQKFSVHFEILQAEYQTLREIADGIRSEDEKTAANLMMALHSILGTMQEAVKV